MNRETESRFSYLPDKEIKRSIFKRPFTHKTTFSTGSVVPIYVDEILPGDTVKMNMGSLLRMQTPIFPVMDNAYCDIMFFFCPSRLVWDHFKEFWGENNLTAWEQQVEYTIPQIEAPANTGWTKGTIADHMGLPIGIPGISVSHLPIRSYVRIWNEWFRDENLKDPAMITMDETTVTGANSGDYVTYAECGAGLLPAARYHDYFSSALKAPQKGPSVSIPLGNAAPIIGTDNVYSGDEPYIETALVGEELYLGKGSNGENYWRLVSDNQTGLGVSKAIGLAADLSQAIGTTINQLRQSFAIQAFYEAQARGGSRYIEFIQNIFGVTSPDGRLQRTEYLGGTRFNINMDQVLQTSSTDNTSPQGNTAAFSCTVSTDELFTHSFVEHGYLIGVAVVRTDHTYQQGIERFWSRKKWEQFYIPQFANLGEMAIELKEIYASGVQSDDESVWGYQEAWSDYRYKPSIVSGEMRSTYSQSLDYMHYGDDYSQAPSLSSSWIDETPVNVDRTIAVQSNTADQFFADFYFDATYTRPMPIYSIPAMLNHF